MAGISSGAANFLIIEAVFFIFLVYSITVVDRNLRPVLALLSRSLRLSEDLFGDERNFVTSARTRYRRAAERIEDVDAHAIASGELSSYEALRIWKWRISMGALSEIMGSAPGVFITIGLLGTFLGLALNLNELSNILSVGSDSSSASPGDLVDRLGGILAPMSTAFVSSLGGVFFSLLFWITGLVMGANRVASDSESLLVAYLEQIVQADCNRFSLMRASVERMELSLAEFMSKFSERVGQAIDEAMSLKVEAVFNAIKVGADSLATYSETMHQGVESLSESGKVFYQASEYFKDSSFPVELGNSLNAFLASATSLSECASQLSSDFSEISASKEAIMDNWCQAQASIVTSSQAVSRVLEGTNEYTRLMVLALEEITESAKQLRAARLAIGKESKASDELTRSLIYELEAGKSERESLIKAVQTLVTQLDQRSILDSRLASLIDSNLSVEGLSPNERRKLVGLLDQLTMSSS
jgi:methyl-accepting chemotaxis protein